MRGADWKFISIHTLLAESDTYKFLSFPGLSRFQSTPSSRRVTLYHCSTRLFHLIFQSTPSSRRVTKDQKFDDMQASISIHTLLAESDWEVIPMELTETISIHTLLAESDGHCKCIKFILTGFQSTPSSRRVTKLFGKKQTRNRISIHTLLAESDIPSLFLWVSLLNFNPHPPRGE